MVKMNNSQNTKRKLVPEEFNVNIRNWVVKYESWDSYNCETEKEAIAMFKKDHPDSDEIIDIN